LLALAGLGFTGAMLSPRQRIAQNLDDLAKVEGLVLSPLFGVVGTVLGFYLGSREKE